MAKLTVLGIGNLLMSDEGIGVRLLDAVKGARDWPEDVEFFDGGAGGLNLLDIIENAERLVVFDAAEMQLKPGAFRIVLPEQVVNDTPEHRISMHDVPFAETLKLCRRFTRCPEFIRVLAIQPKTIDFGRKLSEPITSAFDTLLEAAVDLVNKCLPGTKV